MVVNEVLLEFSLCKKPYQGVKLRLFVKNIERFQGRDRAGEIDFEGNNF